MKLAIKMVRTNNWAWTSYKARARIPYGFRATNNNDRVTSQAGSGPKFRSKAGSRVHAQTETRGE